MQWFVLHGKHQRFGTESGSTFSTAQARNDGSVNVLVLPPFCLKKPLTSTHVLPSIVKNVVESLGRKTVRFFCILRPGILLNLMVDGMDVVTAVEGQQPNVIGRNGLLSMEGIVVQDYRGSD